MIIIYKLITDEKQNAPSQAEIGRWTANDEYRMHKHISRELRKNRGKKKIYQQFPSLEENSYAEKNSGIRVLKTEIRSQIWDFYRLLLPVNKNPRSLQSDAFQIGLRTQD